MKVARIRALRQFSVPHFYAYRAPGGDEGSPDKGIETFTICINVYLSMPVEMKVARIRALRHSPHCLNFLLDICGNEGSPDKGIETS